MEIQRYEPNPRKKTLLAANSKAKGVHKDSWKALTTPRERRREDSSVPRVEVSLRNVVLNDALGPEVEKEPTSGSATPVRSRRRWVLK